ncbi:hypothetical protein PF010_g7125 [Phytophthora fragariae]|nr:hypothetical protein PF009_g7554 [Phytophthora fragariae]KAE9017334.1 hypothetical protein PF011_g6762 [Phytophthora fragariae]KAE9121409.1 hypothetical protein PF010_g7125 [Phytophthora fragariae]KAE9123055.1 hypothetical protein PF007_g7187 [Phytophthora fragariae]KAE9149732.1 hypothetical protein PF006_g5802 [Phytophthora fragariae]
MRIAAHENVPTVKCKSRKDSHTLFVLRESCKPHWVRSGCRSQCYDACYKRASYRPAHRRADVFCSLS